MGNIRAHVQKTDGPRRPYVRSMEFWWLKHPKYRVYMLRELTAAAVAVFALEVLGGVLALNNGLAAWQSCLAFLSHPAGLLLNLVVMALLAFHAWSWFDIMPKTIPPIVLGGRRVPDVLVTRGGQLLFALVTALLVSVVCW